MALDVPDLPKEMSHLPSHYVLRPGVHFMGYWDDPVLATLWQWQLARLLPIRVGAEAEIRRRALPAPIPSSGAGIAGSGESPPAVPCAPIVSARSKQSLKKE